LLAHGLVLLLVTVGIIPGALLHLRIVYAPSTRRLFQVAAVTLYELLKLALITPKLGAWTSIHFSSRSSSSLWLPVEIVCAYRNVKHTRLIPVFYTLITNWKIFITFPVILPASPTFKNCFCEGSFGNDRLQCGS
jgi:hypothetical protein